MNPHAKELAVFFFLGFMAATCMWIGLGDHLCMLAQ